MEACERSFAYLSDELRAAFGAINTVIALVAFTGNLVALLVIVKIKYFRDLSTCFLGSLIMTDFLVGIIVAPMHVAQLVSEPLRNNCTFNDAKGYLSFLLFAASVSSIVLISHDRYLHMTKRQNYGQFMSKAKVAALITIGWVIPAAMVILDALGGKNPRKYARIAAFVFGSLCFVGIVVCYTYIMKTVRKQEKEMAIYQGQDQIQRSRISNDLRVAKVVAAILVCFLITIIPTATYTGLVGINTFLPKGIPGLTETSIEIFNAVVVTLTMANSGINPLIYYLRRSYMLQSMRIGRRFRQIYQEFRIIVCR